jgi:predicted DNA-binding transcriptional regulator YafY
VASAQAKLARIMPDGLKQRVGAIDETVKLDLRSALAPGAAPSDNAALSTLSVAAQTRRRVRLHYRSGGANSEREFDTYGLAYYSGYWYAVGRCYLRQDLRTFRLDRMGQVLPLDTGGPFLRPDDFDALEHLRHAVAAMPRKFAATVMLKTDLATARRALMDTIGLFEQADGGVLLHNQSDDLAWFARQLAGVPFAVEILSPPALREELALLAGNLLRMAAVR